jgi:exopolyphosphatase/guanosine-5'-triphosphate,3'-diphosphate pyrophosphatase
MTDEIRYAVCDVGSNASRLVVARVLGEDPRFLQREASYRVPLRLGEDVFCNGIISEQKANQVLEAFHAFGHLFRLFCPAAVRACATSAMREAQNGPMLADRVWTETGIRIELISGAEEAQTLLFNVSGSWLSPQKNYLYVDVGGGSTEMSLLVQGRVTGSNSFRIGGVRCLADRVEAGEWERLKIWLEGLPRDLGPTEAIGSGRRLTKASFTRS